MKLAGPPHGSNSPDPGNVTPYPRGLLTTDEAARYLSISPRKLQAEVAAGRVRKIVLKPPGATRGPVRFRPADLDAYVESCAVDPVSREPCS